MTDAGFRAWQVFTTLLAVVVLAVGVWGFITLVQWVTTK